MSSALAPDGTDVRTRIDQFLADAGLLAHAPKVVPLTGDASDRQYFRVLLPDGSSQVLSVHPGALDFARLPFVNVARLFDAMHLPVPQILGHSDALGILALEDLGDVTLQAHLGAASADEHTALYREAISLIAQMQERAREHASEDYLPFGIAFDVAKLTWELDYFTKHFLEAYRGARLTDARRTALAHEYASITEELSSEPRVLCHRDFHSRNLMFHGGRLHIIDFQDARMGPDTYDLVSLLRDSYVDLDSSEVEGLIGWFLAQRGASEAGEHDFRRRFDVMALQRNLKALGTFGFQTTSRGNPVYIQYIPRTLAYVRDNLSQYPRFDRLRELLAEYVSELR
jgi:aminoglycoside/choline kinase family phosphotransferase